MPNAKKPVPRRQKKDIVRLKGLDGTFTLQERSAEEGYDWIAYPDPGTQVDFLTAWEHGVRTHQSSGKVYAVVIKNEQIEDDA